MSNHFHVENGLGLWLMPVIFFNDTGSGHEIA
jgi:hypothetical protein